MCSSINNNMETIFGVQIKLCIAVKSRLVYFVGHILHQWELRLCLSEREMFVLFLPLLLFS